MAKKKDEGKSSTPTTKNLFANAKVDAAPAKKKGGSGGWDRESLGAMLDRQAALKTMIDVLEGERKLNEAPLKETVKQIFLDKGFALGDQPANFKGFGEVAEGRCQLSRSISKLTPELREVMDEHKIPYEKAETVPQRYVFDPALLNEDVMRHLSEAIGKHPVLSKIDDLIIVQEEQSFYKTNDQTIPAMFKVAKTTKNRGLLDTLMSEVATLAVGWFQFNDVDMTEGKGEEKTVTSAAKATALGILQAMGILPKAK